MTSDRMATFIKIAAILSASPRWIVGLLMSEGMSRPEGDWWFVFSVISAAVMAIVEGLGFTLAFGYWRKITGRPSSIMLSLLIMGGVVFVGVLTPSIAASIKRVPIGDLLNTDLLLYGWSALVALSSMMVVAMVGYGQGLAPQKKAASQSRATAEPVADPVAEPKAPPAEPVARRMNRDEFVAVWRESNERITPLAELHGVPLTNARRWVKGKERNGTASATERGLRGG